MMTLPSAVLFLSLLVLTVGLALRSIVGPPPG